MAKLEIIQSTGKVATSTTPRTSTLALPVSLANVVGSGYTAVGKAIADIQKDIYALEDQNQVNETLPDVNSHIQKEYDKYLTSTDTEAPQKFEKSLSNKSFEKILSGKNNTVKRLLLNKIAEKKAVLIPKLASQITSNNIDSLAVNINNGFNTALSFMMSSDLGDKGIGAATFKSLINNKVYESYLGKKTWQDIIKKKTSLRNKLVLNADLNIDPKGVIRSKEELLEIVGPVETEKYIERAKENLISKRARSENVERFNLLTEQRSQIGAFTEVLLRINNYKKNIDDENSLNELPTIQELHEMYDMDMLNEAMFVKLSTFLADPERLDGQSTGKTEDEIFVAVTEQLLAANTIDLMSDIQNTILDGDDLDQIALEDISLFSSYIESAKGDFTKHRDYKTYLNTIKANIANTDRVSSRKAQELKQYIASKEQTVIKCYMRKVVDGMTPENAYLATLEEELPLSVIPTLDGLSFPTKIANFEKAIGDNPAKFFDDQYNLVLEKYKKSRMSQFDVKSMLEDLDNLDFAKDIFSIRLNLSGNVLKKATAAGPGLWTKDKGSKKIEVEP